MPPRHRPEPGRGADRPLRCRLRSGRRGSVSRPGQQAPALPWRCAGDPDSNRGHHDFQSCGALAESARFAAGFVRLGPSGVVRVFPYFAVVCRGKRPTAGSVGPFVALDHATHAAGLDGGIAGCPLRGLAMGERLMAVRSRSSSHGPGWPRTKSSSSRRTQRRCCGLHRHPARPGDAELRPSLYWAVARMLRAAITAELARCEASAARLSSPAPLVGGLRHHRGSGGSTQGRLASSALLCRLMSRETIVTGLRECRRITSIAVAMKRSSRFPDPAMGATRPGAARSRSP